MRRFLEESAMGCRWVWLPAVLMCCAALLVGGPGMPEASPGSTGGHVHYTIQRVGKQGPGFIHVASIDDQGEVVGTVMAMAPGHAPQFRVVMVRRGRVVVLNPSGRPDVGHVAGISGNGRTLAATAFEADGSAHAVVWRAGTWADVPGIPGHVSSMLAMSRSGICALSGGTLRQQHCYLWRDGVLNAVDGLPPLRVGDDCVAVNDSAAVCCRTDGHIVIATHGTAAGIRLRTRGFVTATAMNDRGVVVGSVSPGASLREHAFMYSRGKVRWLAPAHGDLYSQPTAINDAGVIVGSSWRAASAQWRAVVYVRGRAIALEDLVTGFAGWSLQDAVAINLRGQIAGQGVFRGKESAFLLTPTQTTSGSPAM